MKALIAMSGGVDSSMAALLTQKEGFECIDCNRFLKFDLLLQRAGELGCDAVVTGHYARVERDDRTGRYLLRKGLDASKDQSYVLYQLTQEQLTHTRMPLGGLTKAEVRRMAEDAGFVTAHKADSACTSGALDPSHVLLALGRSGDEARGSLRLTLGEDISDRDVGQIITAVSKTVQHLRQFHF